MKEIYINTKNVHAPYTIYAADILATNKNIQLCCCCCFSAGASFEHIINFHSRGTFRFAEIVKKKMVEGGNISKPDKTEFTQCWKT